MQYRTRRLEKGGVVVNEQAAQAHSTTVARGIERPHCS
jgi:hypothetical protein